MAAFDDENLLDYGRYHARVDGSGVLVFLPSVEVAPAEGMKDLKEVLGLDESVRMAGRIRTNSNTISTTII